MSEELAYVIPALSAICGAIMERRGVVKLHISALSDISNALLLADTTNEVFRGDQVACAGKTRRLWRPMLVTPNDKDPT